MVDPADGATRLKVNKGEANLGTGLRREFLVTERSLSLLMRP